MLVSRVAKLSPSNPFFYVNQHFINSDIITNQTFKTDILI